MNQTITVDHKTVDIAARCLKDALQACEAHIALKACEDPMPSKKWFHEQGNRRQNLEDAFFEMSEQSKQMRLARGEMRDAPRT